jgi:acyl phosphate:glycerol-3-phosphate acyltransferase
MLLLPAALIAGAYLVGSIPFSYLVVHLVARADIRRHGSGNVGATNVLRNFGKIPGLIALMLDLAKGWTAGTAAAVVLALPQWPFGEAGGRPVDSPAFWIGAAALAAVIGHMYPVWLRLHGGKGVATGAGVFLAIDPMAIGVAVVVFLVLIIGTRYVSLSSMAGAAAVPVAMRFLTHQPFWIVIFSIIVVILVIVRHRANIERLARGTEPRVGSGKAAR